MIVGRNGCQDYPPKDRHILQRSITAVTTHGKSADIHSQRSYSQKLAAALAAKERMFIMYEQGEILVYGNQGVCRLIDIRRERFTDRSAMYYILLPLFDGRSKVYVPVENSKLASKLRPVMVKETLLTMMSEAKQNSAEWEKDDRKRNQLFRDIVADGLTAELLTVMKTLILHKRELSQTVRRLHSADEKTLALCEKIAGEEFAYAFGVEVDDALSHIEQEFLTA